jgi:hypothetical protein
VLGFTGAAPSYLASNLYLKGKPKKEDLQNWPLTLCFNYKVKRQSWLRAFLQNPERSRKGIKGF